MGNTCWFLVVPLLTLLSTAVFTHQDRGCWIIRSHQWNNMDLTHYNCTYENFGDLSTENLDPNRRFINLLHLSLAQNNIRSVKYDTFHHLVKLEILVLSGNFISSLDERVFSNLQSLQHLDLSFNQLSLLSDGLFSSQKNLQALLLNENRLVTISVRMLIPLKSITKLELSKNPLICDCDLRLAEFWCTKTMLYTKATCKNQLSGYVSQWTELESFNNCSKNQVPNVLSESATELTNSEVAVASLTSSYAVPLFIAGAVALQFVCFCLFLLYLKRKRRSSVVTAGEQRAVLYDSSSVHDYQYDYVQIPNSCMPPQLPARPVRTTGNLYHVQVDACYRGACLEEPEVSGTSRVCECCEKRHQMIEPKGMGSHHNNHQCLRSEIISTGVTRNLPEYENTSKMAVSNCNIINSLSDTGVMEENYLYFAVDKQK